MTSALLARERRVLRDLDPAAVWTVAADPSRLPAWSVLGAIEDAGSLLSEGDRFSAHLRIWPFNARTSVRVSRYEAGRSYTLACGLDHTDTVDMVCRVEAVVEESGVHTEVLLTIEAPPLPGWKAAIASRLARYKLMRSRRRLVAAVRSG